MNNILDSYRNHLIARGQSLVYYNYTKVWLSYCQQNGIDYLNITQEDITKYFTVNNYAINTKNNYIKAGRNFLRYLEVKEENNQWTKIDLIRPDDRIAEYISLKELESAIASVITYHSKKVSISKIEAVYRFIFFTGIRKSEFLTLKRQNINIEEGFVKVFGKGRKERIVYFPELMKIILTTYFESEVEEVNAFNVTEDMLETMMRNLNRYIKDKHLTPHTLRHSSAREMLRRGVPLNLVSKILGHTSINTTAIYLKLDDEENKNLYKEKMK